jgi:hypothetical protein
MYAQLQRIPLSDKWNRARIRQPGESRTFATKICMIDIELLALALLEDTAMICCVAEQGFVQLWPPDPVKSQRLI